MFFVDKDGKQIDISVRFFFGVNVDSEHDDLATRARRLRLRLPAECIPVAEAPCGDYVCLVVRGPQRGAVWFWEHEFDTTSDEEEPNYDNMVFLGSDFDEFLDLLQPFDLDAWIRKNM